MKKIRNSAASLVPVLPINRDQWPLPPSLRAWPRGASSVPVRGPTGTSFSPRLLLPVGEPGLKAPTNRDNRGVCPLVLFYQISPYPEGLLLPPLYFRDIVLYMV